MLWGTFYGFFSYCLFSADLVYTVDLVVFSWWLIFVSYYYFYCILASICLLSSSSSFFCLCCSANCLFLYVLISSSCLMVSAWTSLWWMICLSFSSCSMRCLYLEDEVLFLLFWFVVVWFIWIAFRCLWGTGWETKYFVVAEVEVTQLLGAFAQSHFHCC